jgi:hypothetical protein
MLGHYGVHGRPTPAKVREALASGNARSFGQGA